jgi:alanyl-tRNA synthetase
MDTQQTRTTFLDFYTDRGHRRIAGGSLIPPSGDRSVLFTTSGMHPMTPNLLGRPHPQGQRLVNSQRCLRTTDLDQVGDDTHLTVFTMLGSWSLGDYDSSDSLRWGYELLTDGFGLDPRRIQVTVFGGDEQVGPDTESWQTWQELGVPIEPTSNDNWWSNGATGPCGPDSEIFVWTGLGDPVGTPSSDPRWIEVWNHVMMRHHRHPDGTLQPLPQRNIDTGMGLERLLAIVQGQPSVYETDMFQPWTTTVRQLWGLDTPEVRIVSDHLRSAVVALGDGVRPSNTGRGYVLRRLIRRTLTTLWRRDRTLSLEDLPESLLGHTLALFEQTKDPHLIRPLLVEEQGRFLHLLQRGRTLLVRYRGRDHLSEADYSYLRQTHGLPPELVRTLLDDPLD